MESANPVPKINLNLMKEENNKPLQTSIFTQRNKGNYKVIKRTNGTAILKPEWKPPCETPWLPDKK